MFQKSGVFHFASLQGDHLALQTLVEQHKVRAKDERKRKRRAAADSTSAGPLGEKGSLAGQQPEPWEGSHPWRPFNREIDLELGPKQVRNSMQRYI